MRVVIVSREYPPDSTWGGVATGYYKLTQGLAQLGNQVHVICQAVGKPREYVDEGVFVHRVGTNWKRYSALGRINFTVYAWLKLRKIIREHGVEVVEAPYWSAEGSLYSLHKQTPLVVRSQSSAHESISTGTYSGKRELVKLKILAWLADFTAKRADRIVADSKVNYDGMITRLHIDAGKIEVVYPATDTQRFKLVPSNIRDELGVGNGVPVVLSVGRLEAKKGAHILCQAIPGIVQSASSARFILIGRDTNSAPGGGSFKDYITEKARDGGFMDNLMFIDFLPEDKLIQLYSACDLFVLPSLEESFGAVIIEAMACGKPVVATSTGIAIELEPLALKGLKVVPVGDAPKLAEAAIAMLSLTEEDRKHVARQNRALVEERFSLAVWVDKMTEVYEELLKTCKGTMPSP
jgi:glycosyltransferase involved in cell wall biosynthesis